MYQDKSKRYQNTKELQSDLEKAEKGIPATERTAAALDSAFTMPRLLIAAAHSNLGEYREAEAAVRSDGYLVSEILNSSGPAN